VTDVKYAHCRTSVTQTRRNGQSDAKTTISTITAFLARATRTTLQWRGNVAESGTCVGFGAEKRALACISADKAAEVAFDAFRHY
jgi:hypothetical protein